MSETVYIGCKLPNGIILELPKDSNTTASLNGLNAIKIIGADYATTEISKEFWEAWIAGNKEFPAIQSGAIFFARNGQEAEKVAKENKGRKTGFEPRVPKEYGVETLKED